MTQGDEHAERLIGQLVSAGVNITADEGDLIYDGPAHSISEETIAALRTHKKAILAVLADNRARGVVTLGPTTWEQQRMEMRNRLDRNAATYNVCVRVDLHGPIHPEELDRAVTALVSRHETLRTRFAWYGENLLQEIMVPPRSTIQKLPPELLTGAIDDEVKEWCSRRGATPFDLAVEPPARWCYVPIGQHKALLLVTLHHIICDGWSIEILSKELSALYRAGTEENPASAMPPVTMTPRDFARWELEWLDGDRVESARSFWADELRGVTLAPKLKRATGKRSVGRDANSLIRVIPPATAAEVAALAQTRALTEFSVYFAAFAMVLREETDGQDFAIVIAVANRTRREHEGVVGLCRNAVPIRCSVREDDTIDVVAHRISTHVLRALEHQSYPIGVIAPQFGDMPDEADMRRLPLTFGFEPQNNLPTRCPGLSATMTDVFLGAARAEFSLLVRRKGTQMEAFFEYAKDQLKQDDVACIADRYVQIVASVGTTR